MSNKRVESEEWRVEMWLSPLCGSLNKEILETSSGFPLGGSCRHRATDEGMIEPMNALDRLSRATATSSVGRCRHLPL
ncbi:MAG: hypothetical protein ACI4RP_07110 [Acutalibacteraceae bacterium]